MGLSIRAAAGGEFAVDDATLGQLRSSLSGTVLLPGTPRYDVARTVWNAMVDRMDRRSSPGVRAPGLVQHAVLLRSSSTACWCLSGVVVTTSQATLCRRWAGGRFPRL